MYSNTFHNIFAVFTCSKNNSKFMTIPFFMSQCYTIWATLTIMAFKFGFLTSKSLGQQYPFQLLFYFCKSSFEGEVNLQNLDIICVVMIQSMPKINVYNTTWLNDFSVFFPLTLASVLCKPFPWSAFAKAKLEYGVLMSWITAAVCENCTSFLNGR